MLEEVYLEVWGVTKMNTKELLVSMARYIHAFHDVEINVLDPNLQVKLKRFMDETDDPRLLEYWDEYKLALNPDYKKTDRNQTKAGGSQQSKPATYYRGVKVESADDNATDDKTSKKSTVTYRGQKL